MSSEIKSDLNNNLLKLSNISITSDLYQFSSLPLPLKEIVQAYLQYNEALIIYNFFKTSTPIRPILHLDKLILLYDSNNVKDFLATGHEVWYLEHKDPYNLEEGDIRNINHMSKYYTFYWQCPLCRKYTLIETINHLEKEIRIRGHIISNGKRATYYLCSCGIACGKKDLENRDFWRKNDIVVLTEFVSVRTGVVSNIYAEHLLRLGKRQLRNINNKKFNKYSK